MSEQQKQQQNQEVIFASKPKEKPTPDNFKLQDCDYPQLSADGELLVKILYLSVDPYMRPKVCVVFVCRVSCVVRCVRCVRGTHKGGR
jgi:NADPH-dependent curcumin reductase CurA